MTRPVALVLLLPLALAPVCRAQQDGKARAKARNLLPHERMLRAEAAEQSEDSTARMAVWRQYVEPEKRDQFESVLRHVRRIGRAALRDGRMSPLQERTYRSMRVLPSAAPTEDGSVVYLFVADPYVENGDYRVASVLRLARSAEVADSLYRVFRDALSRPRTPPAVVTTTASHP